MADGGPDPAIERLRREFREVAAEARALVEGLDAAALCWQPEPGRWSILECLDHLNATARPYVDVFMNVIQEARAAGVTARRRFRPSLKGRLLIWFMGPPARIKVKNPEAFAPAPAQDPAAVLEEFLSLQDRLAELVGEAAGLDLRAIRFASPVDDRLKLSLGEWFAFHVAHERRHLWQARRVRSAPGFPG